MLDLRRKKTPDIPPEGMAAPWIKQIRSTARNRLLRTPPVHGKEKQARHKQTKRVTPAKDRGFSSIRREKGA
jgi:hypothetical protein